MSRDVSAVTEVAKDVADLGKRAREVGDNLRRDINDTHQALDMVESVSKTLKQATSELRAALGSQTNSPPDDE